MTDLRERYAEIVRLASLVVLGAPRDGQYQAYVERKLLNQLEDALTAAGYNLPGAREKMRIIKKTKAAEDRKQRDAEAVAKYPVGTEVQNSCWNKWDRFARGVVIQPPKRSKAGHVYVRWADADAGWVSAYDLEARK